MDKPTHEDAMLVVQLYQAGTQAGLTEALGWVMGGQSFADYEELMQVPAQRGYLRTVAEFYETVGTLWKAGLINEDLLFDWLSITGVWERVKGLLVGSRTKAGLPSLWGNFEAMAAAQAKRS